VEDEPTTQEAVCVRFVGSEELANNPPNVLSVTSDRLAKFS